MADTVSPNHRRCLRAAHDIARPPGTVRPAVEARLDLLDRGEGRVGRYTPADIPAGEPWLRRPFAVVPPQVRSCGHRRRSCKAVW